MPYDALADFTPVTLTDRSPSVLNVHPSLPVKSVKELIALAKARPGELNYGSSGIGGASHLAGELFKYMAGVNIVWVGYKSGGHATTAVLSGEVQMQISDPNGIAPHVKAGRLRALAVTTLQPSPLVPGLPTVSESGVPGYEAAGLTGVFAPAKTPAAIINRLNQECARLLNQPEVKERLFNLGLEAVGNTSEQFIAIIKSDITRMGKVIKEAGIKIQ
jgi:tripartite-type tricarboxylate transporter receptor subunit TctC